MAYPQTVTDRAMLEALTDALAHGNASTVELAKRVPISRQAIHKRLVRFERLGWVETMAARRARDRALWMLTADGIARRDGA